MSNVFVLEKTIKITAKLHSGYISYVRIDTGAEVSRSREGVYEWACINGVNVELDVLALTATCFE